MLHQTATDSISLEVEWNPIWEVILGIAGYTHSRLRYTFEMDENWSEATDSMPESLIQNLKEIEETNFWYGMIMLQDKLSARTVQEFSDELNRLSLSSFYEILLPYKGRDLESSRKDLANHYEKLELFEKYAAHFEGHDYLDGYIRNIGRYSYQSICDLLINTIEAWLKWTSQHEEWDKWSLALEFESKQYSSLDLTKAMEEIERVTGGVKYLPEPSIWSVKMIPHISYRPWLLEIRTADTKLFFYPIKDEYLVSPGEPPAELVRGHKALGDELRLKLLFHLLKGPFSLQELSMQFNTSKTRLHHQLSLLKAAKFVVVDKGIYSVNPVHLHSFSEKLTQYLGIKK